MAAFSWFAGQRPLSSLARQASVKVALQSMSAICPSYDQGRDRRMIEPSESPCLRCLEHECVFAWVQVNRCESSGLLIP